MGSLDVVAIRSDADRNKYYSSIISDLKDLDQMIVQGRLDEADNMIGAEQELCIVDQEGRPAMLATTLLPQINEPHYTKELALFNLEINCDPMRLGQATFRNMESHLLELLQQGMEVASAHNAHLFMTGVLPTLKYRHLDFQFMTPEERYKILSNELIRLRGSEFQIHLEGVDEMHARLDSVLFEACNTSFQSHLQVNPKKFNEAYNWSQMISGPVLAACTNSPILFGRELWHENRIALFKQSLDTRTYQHPIRKFLPRVAFGDNWLTGGPSGLWKSTVARFPLLLMPDGLDELHRETEGLPTLDAIRLLNGTTYTWNRLCYGINQDVAHIRIECRYMPSGPTVVDEIANLAFWVGLMHARPESFKKDINRISFKVVKDNFIRAARTGIHSHFNWFGKYRAGAELLENELIPMAATGLAHQGVSDTDIHKYLGIIQNRVTSGKTGSEWMIKNFRKLRESYKPPVCERILVKESLQYQESNEPVHNWEPVHMTHYYRHLPFSIVPQNVEDVMNTEVFALHEKASLELAVHVMKWRGFHHLLIEDDEKQLSGILSLHQIERDHGEEIPDVQIEDVMTRVVITIEPEQSLQTAVKLMDENEIHCLPVLENGNIVGILTEKDFKTIDLAPE